MTTHLQTPTAAAVPSAHAGPSPMPSTWDANAHFQGWYPVALATELAESPLLGKDFLGTRVVIYRTATGDPVVLHAYCAHLGADLARGELTEDGVQCGFHHFRYGPDGACTYAPGGHIPDAARVFSFPVAERWGVVWAFNGADPLYDIPEWPGREGEPMVSRVRRIDVPCEPWVLVANAYDILHLRELHGLDVPLDPTDIVAQNPYVLEFDIEWVAPGVGTMQNHGRSYGTNAFFSRNAIVGGHELFSAQASTPTRGGRVECYMFVGLPDERDGTAAMDQAIEERLRANEEFVDRLVQDDLPILEGLRFVVGATVPGDRLLNYFLKHVRRFPRVDPEHLAAELRTAQ